MDTYQKTCLICPHCGERTDSSIDHLQKGCKFGPWYCDSCGKSYEGVANGVDTVLKKCDKWKSDTLDLLGIPPHDKTIYFVLRGDAYHKGEAREDDWDGKQFFYEEHSCPTNWIRNTAMISADGDTDPHGFMKFIRSVKHPKPSVDMDDEGELITTTFPEIL